MFSDAQPPKETKNDEEEQILNLNIKHFGDFPVYSF